MARPSRAFWHFSVLALALPGCFDSHGDPELDAGAPDAPAVDAATCGHYDASVSELRCEVLDGEVVAHVTSSPTSCCTSGTPSAAVASAGTSHLVELEWDACGCCDDCFCLGPMSTTDVELGVLPPGTHTITAGTRSCTLVVEEPVPPPVCEHGTGDEVRMPAGLFGDQPLVFTLRGPGTGGCGCDPVATTPTPTANSTVLNLCDCCWTCDCIDDGYEATNVGETWPLGGYSVATPSGVRAFLVTTRDAVTGRDPVTLRVVAPDPERTIGGPRVHWAVVTTMERPCCVDPVLVVEEVPGTAGEITLAVHAANLEDCGCIGEPREVEAWYPLLDLPSGHHVVRAGSQHADVEVP